MPEAPDLEVVKEVMARRAAGRKVASATVLRPTVLRSLAAQDFGSDIAGRTIEAVSRRGKFLLMAFSGGAMLVINPMLTGAIQLCAPSEKVLKRTCIVLRLDDFQELRYLDDKQMGQVYYVMADQLGQVPRMEEQGPDVLDDEYSFEQFKARLKRYHGEIKGILTRGAVISGIGNAYSDEILFAAGISPFRKRASLSDGELKALFASARRVVTEALTVPALMPRIRVTEFAPLASTAAAALDEAQIVIGVGRGVGGPAALPAIEALAAQIGAALGATREVTDAGWLPRQLQIGLTGRAIAPRLYLALGIKGTMEHMVGLRRAGTIVAINKAANAPIFKSCDLGIVADYATVLPHLSEALTLG